MKTANKQKRLKEPQFGTIMLELALATLLVLALVRFLVLIHGLS